MTLPRLTKAERAAYGFIRARLPRSAKRQLDKLINICSKACDGLFIIDPFASCDDPQRNSRKRNFIEEFILQYLQSFRGNSKAQLIPHLDTFRYIGKACRQALIKEIRDCPLCGSRKRKTADGYKCKYGCGTLSVHTSLDADYSNDTYDVTALADLVVAPERVNLWDWIEYSRPDLQNLGLYDGLTIYWRVFEEGLGERAITRTWALAYKLSEQQAYRQKLNFLSSVKSHRHHWLVRELYDIILKASDSHKWITPILAIEESRETKAARLAASQAARELAEFNSVLNPQIIREANRAAADILEQEKQYVEAAPPNLPL